MGNTENLESVQAGKMKVSEISKSEKLESEEFSFGGKKNISVWRSRKSDYPALSEFPMST